MKKQIALFAAAFVIGATLALAVRAARHDPYADHRVPPAPTPPMPMVDNTTPKAQPPPTHNAHAGHDMAHNAAAAPATADSESAVNTICPICGMTVDPKLPSATYAGQRVGFGCAMCPPKFAVEPDRYGPAALRNEQAE